MHKAVVIPGDTLDRYTWIFLALCDGLKSLRARIDPITNEVYYLESEVYEFSDEKTFLGVVS